MDCKVKHLEIIQGIITRMAQNSFMIKGWTLSLIIATYAFISSNILYITLVLCTIILFSSLDAYYLYLEKEYRSLYDIVRLKDEEQIDFCVRIDYEKGWVKKYFKCLFNKTIVLFYLALIIVNVVVFILI